MRKRAGAIALGVALAFLILFEVIPWRCPFALLFGIPCPTCGFTRAMRSVMHGDFASAFHFHPLWPAIFVVVGAIVIAESISFVRSGPNGTYRGRKPLFRVGFVLAVTLFVVWIARFFGAFGGPVS